MAVRARRWFCRVIVLDQAGCRPGSRGGVALNFRPGSPQLNRVVPRGDQELRGTCPARVHPDGETAELRNGRQREVADDRDDASDEALIAYVRGRLPEAEAARIAAAAARRPELAAEIALIRGIAAATAAEAEGPAPGELGWARLSRSIDAERGPPATPRQAAALAARGRGGRRGPGLAGGRRSLPPRPGRGRPLRAGLREARPWADPVGGLRPGGDRGGDPGVAPGDRRAHQRRPERDRPLAARLPRRPARDAGLARLREAAIVESAQAE